VVNLPTEEFKLDASHLRQDAINGAVFITIEAITAIKNELVRNQNFSDEFEDIIKSYETKQTRLSNWQQQFKDLEEAVSQLSAFFEDRYEHSEVNGDLPEEIKSKLENRREGIRLSVKSASRLLRKLNPEKTLPSCINEYITEDKLVNEIYNKNKNVLVDSQLAQTLRSLISNLADIDVQDVNLQPEIVPNDSEKEKTQPVSEKSEETEVQSNENEEENTEVSLILGNTIQKNRTALEELSENLDIVEKRFLTFIEKTLAPVMDGLTSGRKHGESLIDDLGEINDVHLEYVKNWLSVYEELLDVITQVLHQFHIALSVPNVGDVFYEQLHEPIAVVEDLNFGNEEVKEVVRYGLIYEGIIYDQESFLIRPAQVIVVKNASEKQTIERDQDTDGCEIDSED